MYLDLDYPLLHDYNIMIIMTNYNIIFENDNNNVDDLKKIFVYNSCSTRLIFFFLFFVERVGPSVSCVLHVLIFACACIFMQSGANFTQSSVHLFS